MEAKTFSNRSNARRAGVQAGVPVELVEITVHKNKGEVRFGFKRKAEQPATAAPVVNEQEPAVTTPAQREERNGIKRPAPGGKCAEVWTFLDAHPGITVKEAKKKAADHGWNANNVSAEFYQWRKFHGVSGRSAEGAQ